MAGLLWNRPYQLLALLGVLESEEDDASTSSLVANQFLRVIYCPFRIVADKSCENTGAMWKLEGG
jgi:hypothetical protein